LSYRGMGRRTGIAAHLVYRIPFDLRQALFHRMIPVNLPMTDELPTDSDRLTVRPGGGREGLLPDEVGPTDGVGPLSVLLVEGRTRWRYVRNVLLALIGLYGGATIGCNLGAPAMGIEHSQSVMAVWQLGVAGGIVGGLGLVLTARRQRGVFLLWLLFGAGLGA